MSGRKSIYVLVADALGFSWVQQKFQEFETEHVQKSHLLRFK